MKLLLIFCSLICLYCCNSQYEYKHYYDGYTLKKGERRAKVVETSFDNLGAPVDPNAPQMTYTLMGHTYNSSEARVKFDVANSVIYLLTFKMENGKINDSNLFISTTMGLSYEEVDLKYKGADIVVTEIYVGPGVVVAIANYAKVISTSVNFGKTWKQSYTFYPVVDVLINYMSPYKIALITQYNYLYLTSNNGTTWNSKSWGAFNCTWEYGSTYLYFLEKVYVDYATMRYRMDLYRCSPEASYSSLVTKDIYRFGTSHRILWAIVNRPAGLLLMISIGTDRLKYTLFPEKLKIKDYYVHGALQLEVFVAVVNEANQVYLYSAALQDLRFWRVDDDVGKYYESSKSFCVEMESFHQLPGVLLGQKIKGSAIPDQSYTAISYSHGTKWAHVTAPRFVEGKQCDWPTCFLRLTMRCTASGINRPITTVEGSPAVMVAQGVIVRANERDIQGVFISTDSGKTWIRALKNARSYTLLDKGGIIFTYPEYSYDAFFSYDFGLSWRSVNITSNKFRALGTFSDPSSVSLVAATVGYDEDTMDWSIIRIDFSQPVSKSCSLSDYEVFTPGSSRKDQCFQGKKNSFYKRKHNVTCRSILDQLPAIENVPCPCTDDDFGCAFGYYLKNGDCLPDPDYVPEQNNTCSMGEFFLRPTSKAKLIGDVCTNNGSYSDEESDICMYTDNDDTISLLVGTVIKFININNGIVSNVTKVPVNIRNYGNLMGYDVDHAERCLYYLNTSGVAQLCWNTRAEALDQHETMFLKDRSLLGIRIDEFTDNMYVYNSSTISIIHVFSRYRATILQSDKDISYFNIFPTAGYLVYTVTNTRPTAVETSLILCTLSGARVSTNIITEKVYAVAYSTTDNKLYVFAEKVYYIMNIDGSDKQTKSHTFKGIINAYVKNNKRYVIHEGGIFIDPSTTVSHSHISDADLHLVSDHPQKNPCLLSSCKYLCFSDPYNSYQCGCPDTMTISDDRNDCVCDSLHPKCKECKPSEFHCDNQKCIDLSAKCNGVDNCGDNSDEFNCTLVCQADEFSCDSNTKCIDIIQRCDGVKDCEDGTDELECREVTRCQNNEFQCVNEKCIPIGKQCDGVDDCGDFSDEDSCKSTSCRYFEVKCDNGECILPSQVCNGVFDCTDWSDETKCGKIDDGADPTCVIRCDNKCVPREKMCDHITDCQDGQDELNCPHIFDCPLPGQEKCTNSFSCYNVTGKCDGFAECDDGSDEKDCPDFDFCSDPESFKCDLDAKCIPLNKVCDGVVDCDDRSDEKQRCLNDASVKSIQIDNRDAGVIDFSWSVANIKRNTAFNVTIIPKISPNDAISFQTADTFIKIPNLVECMLYTLYVRIVGGVNGRALQFVARRYNNGLPSDVYYDVSDFSLKWVRTYSQCIPETFYVECAVKDEISYRNFSKTTSIPVKYSPDAVCKISSCVANIYNISCSDFSPLIYLSSYNASYSFVKYGVPIIIFIILVCVVGFVYFKVRKGVSFNHLVSLFKQRLGFKSLQNKNSMDEIHLNEDLEEETA